MRKRLVICLMIILVGMCVFGIISNAIYMIYLYIFENVNLYRYILYLILIIILICIDNVLLKKGKRRKSVYFLLLISYSVVEKCSNSN